MIDTKHKGYMMLNRNFDLNECQYNEYNASYYIQINKNTLVFNHNAVFHYYATDEVFTLFYTKDKDKTTTKENYIVETCNEFLVVMFDYDFDFPPKPPQEVNGVTIWLPHSLDIFSWEQISFLEELINTCRNFHYVEVRDNEITKMFNPSSSYGDSVEQKIKLLEDIVEAAKETKKQFIK